MTELKRKEADHEANLLVNAGQIVLQSEEDIKMLSERMARLIDVNRFSGNA